MILNISVLGLCSLWTLHFLFVDSHVLPDTKHDRSDTNTLPVDLHPTIFCVDESIGHSRRRYACGRMNRVIVSLDKFRQNVYISVGIFICKILVQSISDYPMSMFHDRTFDFGMFAIWKWMVSWRNMSLITIFQEGHSIYGGIIPNHIYYYIYIKLSLLLFYLVSLFLMQLVQNDNKFAIPLHKKMFWLRIPLWIHRNFYPLVSLLSVRTRENARS